MHAVIEWLALHFKKAWEQGLGFPSSKPSYLITASDKKIFEMDRAGYTCTSAFYNIPNIANESTPKDISTLSRAFEEKEGKYIEVLLLDDNGRIETTEEHGFPSEFSSLKAWEDAQIEAGHTSVPRDQDHFAMLFHYTLTPEQRKADMQTVPRQTDLRPLSGSPPQPHH